MADDRRGGRRGPPRAPRRRGVVGRGAARPHRGLGAGQLHALPLGPRRGPAAARRLRPGGLDGGVQPPQRRPGHAPHAVRGAAPRQPGPVGADRAAGSTSHAGSTPSAARSRSSCCSRCRPATAEPTWSRPRRRSPRSGPGRATERRSHWPPSRSGAGPDLASDRPPGQARRPGRGSPDDLAHRWRQPRDLIGRMPGSRR